MEEHSLKAKNEADELYFDEQFQQVRYALERIRSFFTTAFYVLLVFINYRYTPDFLWYPWVLILFIFYTAYRLVYPLSVGGFLGTKLQKQSMKKLKKEVNEREKYYAEVRAGRK